MLKCQHLLAFSIYEQYKFHAQFCLACNKLYYSVTCFLEYFSLVDISWSVKFLLFLYVTRPFQNFEKYAFIVLLNFRLRYKFNTIQNNAIQLSFFHLGHTNMTYMEYNIIYEIKKSKLHCI